MKPKPFLAAHPLVLPLGIALAALGLRVVYLLQIHDTPLDWGLVTDSSVYETAARAIAAGNFAYANYGIINPFYPFFAGCFYRLFGFHQFPIVLVQAAIDAVSTLLIYRVAKDQFGALAAIVASAAYAIDGMAIFYSGIRIATTLEIFLAIAFAALVLRSCERRQSYGFLPAGLAGGILAQARGNFFVVLGVVSLWLFWKRRQDSGTRPAVLSVASLCAGIAVILCLLSLRNYLIGGDASPFVGQSGLVFYIGNNPRATGLYSVPAGLPPTPLAGVTASVYLAKLETGRDLTAAQASHYWFAKAADFIRSQPWREAGLLAKKLLLFFRKEEAPMNVVYELAFKDVPLLRQPLVSFGLVAPLALLGVAIAVIMRTGSFLLVYLFSYVGSLLLFFITGRYRLPMLPVLLIFAGFGVQQVVRLAREKDMRAVGLSLAALAGFAFVSVYDLPVARFAVNPATHYHNLGTQYLQHGLKGEAAAYLRKAIDVDSTYATAYYSLGIIEEKARPDVALALFQKAIALDSLQVNAHLHAGVLLAARKEPEEAARHFARALALDPANAAAHGLLGNVFFERGLFPQALEHYGKVLALDPKNADAWFNAGAACYHMKSYGQALDYFSSYLRLAPDDSVALRSVSELRAKTARRGE